MLEEQFASNTELHFEIKHRLFVVFVLWETESDTHCYVKLYENLIQNLVRIIALSSVVLYNCVLWEFVWDPVFCDKLVH